MLGRNEYLLDSNKLRYYQLLHDFSHKDKLMEYCHPAVLALMEYDRKKGTDYYHTLLAYLLNNQDIIEAAQKLYIHRNTMKNRLNKINLEEGETIFQIAYTYKLLTYLKSQEAGV